MRVVITGGGGFVGLNLVERLLASEFDILVIDNFEYPTEHLLKGFGVSYLKRDLRDVEQIKNLFEDGDAIIHLAAKGNVVQSVDSPRANFESNVVSTFNVVEAAGLKNISKLIFSSTLGALFGNSIPPFGPDTPPSPISPYGASKMACEAYMSAFANLNPQCDVSILRFGNVLGPFCSHKIGVVQKMFANIQKGEPLVANNCRRDFVHVHDIADAMVNLLRRPKDESKINENNFHIYHFGTGIPVHIKTLASSLGKLLGLEELKIIDGQTTPGEVGGVYATDANDLESLIGRRVTPFSVALCDTLFWLSTQKKG